MKHEPVLRDECVDALVHKPSGLYVDATFGAGGHSEAILDRLDANGRLIAFDQDKDTLGNALDDPRFQLLHSNFRMIDKFIDWLGWPGIDGLFADLGMSSMQLDEDDAGFSFRYDGKLDMRMDGYGRTAAEVLNEEDERYLQEMLSSYGEVRNARTLAKAVINRRAERPFVTVADLNEVLAQHVIGHRNRYFAQVYQALRIEVNDEMTALTELLQIVLERLRPGGRLVVLSYHSLEDRMVKRFMRSGNIEGRILKDDFGHKTSVFEVLTRKPIVPDAIEIQRNSRARSAKLRIAQRT